MKEHTRRCSFPQVRVGKGILFVLFSGSKCSLVSVNQSDLPHLITIMISPVNHLGDSVINLLSEVCSFVFARYFLTRSPAM